VLHNPVAIDYFYEYLENLEEEEEEYNNHYEAESEYTWQGNHANNFRLLALYMDIRCYETIIRKVKESKRFNDAIRDFERSSGGGIKSAD
jgi:hypothetical protein